LNNRYDTSTAVDAEAVISHAGVREDGADAVERHSAIATLAAEWEALAERVDAPPFVRPGWIEAWMGAFSSARPAILATRTEGRLTGVLPLLRRHGALTSPTNWHTPAFGALVDGRGAARALAEALLAERAACTDLSHLDATDPLIEEVRNAAGGAGRRTIERLVARQPYVDLSGGFDAYEATLPRKHRKEVGRLRRRLAAEGTVSFEFADGSERLDALLEEGFAIEGSGWKADQGSAIVSRPDTLRFYTDIARWAAAGGWLRLAFLRLDGRAIAFDMCIEAAGATYVLKGGFDASYRRLGPGVVLTHESLARAFERDLASYEFLGSDDAYKLSWTTTARERVRLQTFSQSPLGVVHHVAWSRGRPFAKRALAKMGRA
jgi:CelD/BcsL family acetyltransferase involved in cellulose biosynthesis